uniref:Uncharacterized protein n=1 Tax=Anguilla anguilla TaxID=7936 RepID=A0A0E9UDJ3_ANGAN
MMQSSCLIKILIELHVSMNLKFIWGKLLCSFGRKQLFQLSYLAVRFIGHCFLGCSLKPASLLGVC